MPAFFSPSRDEIDYSLSHGADMPRTNHGGGDDGGDERDDDLEDATVPSPSQSVSLDSPQVTTKYAFSPSNGAQGPGSAGYLFGGLPEDDEVLEGAGSAPPSPPPKNDSSAKVAPPDQQRKSSWRDWFTGALGGGDATLEGTPASAVAPSPAISDTPSANEPFPYDFVADPPRQGATSSLDVLLSSRGDSEHESQPPLPLPPREYLLTVVPSSNLSTESARLRLKLPKIISSRGTLVPLHATVKEQVAAIAAEYSLPSADDIDLYLLSTAETVKSQLPTTGGPRISSHAWRLLWRELFPDHDTNRDAQSNTDVGFSSASEAYTSPYPATTPSQISPSSSFRSPSDAFSPFAPFSPQSHRRGRSSPSSLARRPSTSTTLTSPGSAESGVFGSCLVVGRVEFDIDFGELGFSTSSASSTPSIAWRTPARGSFDSSSMPHMPRKQSWAKPRRTKWTPAQELGDDSGAATAGTSENSAPVTPRESQVENGTSEGDVRPPLMSRWTSTTASTLTPNHADSSAASSPAVSTRARATSAFSPSSIRTPASTSTSHSQRSSLEVDRRPSVNLASFLGNYPSPGDGSEPKSEAALERLSDLVESESENEHEQHEKQEGVGLGVMGLPSEAKGSVKVEQPSADRTTRTLSQHRSHDSMEALKEALGLPSPEPPAKAVMQPSSPVFADVTNRPDITESRLPVFTIVPPTVVAAAADPPPPRPRATSVSRGSPPLSVIAEMPETPRSVIVRSTFEPLDDVSPRSKKPTTPAVVEQQEEIQEEDDDDEPEQPVSLSRVLWSTTPANVPLPSRPAPPPPSKDDLRLAPLPPKPSKDGEAGPQHSEEVDRRNSAVSDADSSGSGSLFSMVKLGGYFHQRNKSQTDVYSAPSHAKSKSLETAPKFTAPAESAPSSSTSTPPTTPTPARRRSLSNRLAQSLRTKDPVPAVPSSHAQRSSTASSTAYSHSPSSSVSSIATLSSSYSAVQLSPHAVQVVVDASTSSGTHNSRRPSKTLDSFRLAQASDDGKWRSSLGNGVTQSDHGLKRGELPAAVLRAMI